MCERVGAESRQESHQGRKGVAGVSNRHRRAGESAFPT